VPSPPAAVMFDNDGLVLDTEVLWTRAEEALFERYGRTFTTENKREMLGSSGEHQAQLLATMLEQPDRGTLLRTEMYELVMEETRGGAEAMPGALELLARVREAGLPLGLASNSHRPFVEAVIDAAGIRAAFDVILSVEDVARPKPAPDLYLALAQRLGTTAEQCVALEDSPTGVAAARAAGAFTIGVPSYPGVVLHEADVVCASLFDPQVYAALGISAS
jgi:HAD superfamily hydrolase (TIGR01509 family)